MILVKTFLDKAGDKGIGLFAAESLKAGTIWWIESPEFDRIIPAREYAAMSDLPREFVDKYAYLDDNGDYYVCLDNARFINHSDNPNTANGPSMDLRPTIRVPTCVVTRDIAEGEEMTCDYRELSSKSVPELGFENEEQQ